MMLLCLSLLFITNPVQAKNPAETRVYDEAEVLSEMQLERLEVMAEEYSEKRELDFLIFTIKDVSQDIEDYMDDFYDDSAPGYNKAHGDVAMLGLDMTERDIVLLGFGKAEKELDPDRLTMIREEVTPHFSEENYYDGFEQFILLADEYMNYKPGVNPHNPFYKTSVQLLIALVIGGTIVGAMVFRMNPRMTTNAQTYHDGQRSKILHRHDRFIRRTVTKRRKPKQSSGGSGGGSGGIGRTSGGFSRSSSRGKF